MSSALAGICSLQQRLTSGGKRLVLTRDMFYVFCTFFGILFHCWCFDIPWKCTHVSIKIKYNVQQNQVRWVLVYKEPRHCKIKKLYLTTWAIFWFILIFICSDIDGSIGWYNAIRPALKSFLKSRLGKSLLNKLSGFFKRVLNSLWKGKVKDLWNTLIEWIRSRDPVSWYQEMITVYWLRNHIYPCPLSIQ